MRKMRQNELQNAEIETPELTLEEEASILNLISEIKREIGYYQRSDNIKAALEYAKKTGDLNPLKATGYFDDIKSDEEMFLNRPDVKGNLRKELAVKTAFNFLMLPVREIERSKITEKKKELLLKRKLGQLSDSESKELESLFKKTLDLNYRDSILSNEVFNFLVNNGYHNPEVIKKFWEVFSTLELETKIKKEAQSGFLGAVAIFYLISEFKILDFKHSTPKEDVEFAIDGYIENKEKALNLPIQIKHRSEYIVYENENPEDTIVLKVTPDFDLETLSPLLKPLKKDVKKFAQGLKKIDAKEGLFVVIPGKIKTKDKKFLLTIDQITAKPTDRFKSWFSRVFYFLL